MLADECQVEDVVMRSEYNNKNAMADTIPSSPEKMKQLPSNTDNLGDLDEQSNQGDCEEQEERDPNYVEDRFRVDRRKLEQMLQG